MSISDEIKAAMTGNAAQIGLDAKAAQQHCTCGATAIEKNFSDDEIKDLNSSDGVDAKLMQKAQTVVKQACTKG